LIWWVAERCQGAVPWCSRSKVAGCHSPAYFGGTTKLLNATEIPALHFGGTTKLLNGTRMSRYFFCGIFFGSKKALTGLCCGFVVPQKWSRRSPDVPLTGLDRKNDTQRATQQH
jgi:hypothetical protein